MIQIVIDIDEEYYKIIKHDVEHGNDYKPWVLIANGTPLPKGHGRLIDADAFQKYCFNKNFEMRLSDGGLCFINLFLSDAPTIIEADVQNKEQDFQI